VRLSLSFIAALAIALMTVPAHADPKPVKGAVQGTATVGKGVVQGGAQAGKGVVRGGSTVVKSTGKGLRCIVTLGTRC
jgi:hypothetical protein